MSQLTFSMLAFSNNFCPIKVDVSGNTVPPQASVFFQKLFLGLFIKLLSTQNVNVVHFACNVEFDFFCDYQTPWSRSN